MGLILVFNELNRRRPMVNTLHVLLLISLYLFSYSTYSNDVTEFVELDENTRHVFNPPQVEYYADIKGTHTIESLLMTGAPFAQQQSTFTFLSPKVHWYRLPIKNASQQTLRWVLGIGVASPLGLNAYWVDERQTVTPIPLTKENQYGSGAHTNILLTLSAKQRGRVYLAYQSFAHFSLNLSLHAPDDYLNRSLKYTTLNGMALGALLAFLLFFVAHFFLNRRLHIGFYCLFVLSIFLFAVQVFGYGVKNFWPDKMLLNSQMTSFFAGCIYLFYFLFTAYLFDHTPRLRKALLALAGIVGLVSLIGFFRDMALLVTAIVTAGLPLAIVSAFYALPSQRVTAIYFIIGSGLHYALTCLLLLKLMGMRFESNSFALATLGQLVDIICLSIAILLQSRSTEKQLHWQVTQRLRDLEALTASEQHATELRSINKDAILNSATTAHDVLQVLSSIRLQVAMKKANDPSAALLDKTVTYATELLSNRLHKGKQDFVELSQRQNIAAILSNLAMRYQLNHPNLRFRAHAHDIVCSELVINRIVDNLLSNALKFTRGGHIMLTGRVRKNGYWIQVWDQGQGIPEDKLKKIFEPFTQLANHNIDDWGFGLGLYIVRFLCEDSHYSFTVNTQRGKGTCFSIAIENPQS
jgi:two-component system, sensor histidine kinase LadS